MQKLSRLPLWESISFSKNHSTKTTYEKIAIPLGLYFKLPLKNTGPTHGIMISFFSNSERSCTQMGTPKWGFKASHNSYSPCSNLHLILSYRIQLFLRLVIGFFFTHTIKNDLCSLATIHWRIQRTKHGFRVRNTTYYCTWLMYFKYGRLCFLLPTHQR